jgi:hypothetical protein
MRKIASAVVLADLFMPRIEAVLEVPSFVWMCFVTDVQCVDCGSRVRDVVDVCVRAAEPPSAVRTGLMLDIGAVLVCGTHLYVLGVVPGLPHPVIGIGMHCSSVSALTPEGRHNLVPHMRAERAAAHVGLFLARDAKSLTETLASIHVTHGCNRGYGRVAKLWGMHAAAVAVDENDELYAFCECGWRVMPGPSRKELRTAANEHSDPEVVERWVYETQLNYPQYTREQIINMEFD